MKEYEWFRVHVEKKNGGVGFSVHVTSSLDSRTFDWDFVSPFDENEARGLLSEIDESVGSKELIGHKRLLEIGGKFYKSVFSKDAEKYFGECLENAKKMSHGLRIELFLEPLYLRRLPWELMHDGKGFLALSAFTPIVRSISRAGEPQSREIFFPLGILFVAASPVGPYDPIDVDGEIRLLCKSVSESVKEGKVFLQCYGSRKIKSQGFSDDVKSGQFHVLHVSSHGKFSERIDKGILQLEDEDGRPFLLSIETLSEWLRSSSIQLVYLDACETGVGSVRSPLADLSHVFLDKGVGAVVAMQFSVPVSCANTFCHVFYSGLSKGESVESCVTEARTRIVHPVLGLDSVDWAIPVLYMLGKDVLRVGGIPQSIRTCGALPAVGLFVGREQQLNELTGHLVDPDVAVVLVHGFGGIGKSTTVTRLVRDICSLYYDVCWIECRTKPSHDEVVQKINDVLLYHGVGCSSAELAERSPEGKNNLLAFVLENRGRFLVVLDNLDAIEKSSDTFRLLKDLLMKLEGKRSKVIVTLRVPVDLSGKRRSYCIEKLEEGDALLLMRKLGEKHHIESVVRAEDSVLKKINARVDGHPKAIEVVIPVLESEPLEKVLEGLPEVLADDIGPILDWSFKLLTPEAKAFLLEISVYDGVVEYEGLSAIHGGGVSVLVKELVEKNLLSYDDVRKLYSLHPLVREFAYNQVEKERRRELHRMAARYFWSEKGKDPVRGIYHSYDAEDWKDGMSATHTILETLIVRGFWTEAKSLCEEGLSVSRKIEDEKEESYFLFSLARMLWRLGELDEAVKLYKQSLEILEKLGDQSGISRSLHQLAMIEQDRGNYDEAVKLYKQSLEILEKLGDQSGISASLHQLANVEYLRGNYDEAVKLYKQSLEIKQKLGDQRGIAISFHALGLLSETRNQLDLAKEYLEKALQIFRKIGDKPNMNKAEKVLQRILSETQEKQ